MGLSDRDYARSTPSGSGGSGRAGRNRAGVGSVRVLSVNTWLIIVNVAVFLLSQYVLVNYQDKPPQRVSTLVSAGTFYKPEATPDQIKRGQVDETTWVQVPGMTGFIARP